MNKKYSIDFFQNASDSNSVGTNLNDAYKKGLGLKSLTANNTNIFLNSSNNAEASNITQKVSNSNSEPQGSNISNSWNFFGIDDLSIKKKKCLYNCGIDILGCMERCANPDCREQENLSHEQCKYGCIRKGLSCSTGCISEIESSEESNIFDSNNINNPTISSSQSQPTETSHTTTQSIKHTDVIPLYDINPSEIQGFYSDIDSYAPYDMRVWPKNGKFGWTLSELNRMKHNGYDVPNVIEVNMNHSLYPLKTDKPSMVFDL